MAVPSQVAEASTAPAEEVSSGVAGRSLTQIAWARLRRDKVAMISLWALVIIFLVAIFAPLICKAIGVSPTDFDSNAVSQDGGLPIGWGGGISLTHPLGVEPLTGRDIFARLLYGARISLLIAVVGSMITTVLGVFFGIVAGYSRGFLDATLGRVMDLILSFPQLLILLALSLVLIQNLEQIGFKGNSARITYIILVLSVFSWPYLARIVRGQVLSIREREFVEAAVSMGAGTRRILFKEILPNLWAPILVYVSISLPTFIAAEASLSFLSVGVNEPTPTWGKMLADSVRFFTVDPAYLFIPGTALFIVVLAFNLLGDALRDALDPRAGRV